MSRYQEIRDTKIDWIGKIPSHWNINKIKYIFFRRKEKNDPPQTENILSLTIQDGVIPISEKKSSGNKPKDDLTKYNLTYKGDIVMNSMNVIVGSVGISNYFGLVSPVYYILKQINPKENIRYYHHLFRTKIFQKSLIGLGNGILIKKSESSGKLNTIRMRIPIDKLNQVVIPHPPIDEQNQIVSFLDIKTQKIEKLIQKTKQKIELLKEKEYSLINHCVTKGLSSNVEMKDSGFEWIGKIPVNWDVKMLKFIFRSIRKKSETGEEELLSVLIKKGVVKRRDFLDNDSKHLTRSKSLIGYIKVSKDNLVNNIMKMGFYCLGISGYNGIVSPGYSVFEMIDNNNNSKFWDYLLKTEIYVGEYRKRSKGIQKSRMRLYDDYFLSIHSLVPPIIEQNQIVEHLDLQTQKIKSSIEKETQRIELLEEYRQSFISEVVTGKVDVRDYNG